MNRLLGLVLVAGASALAAQTPAAPRSATVAEQYLLAAADQERAAANLPPLHVDSSLVQAATDHASLLAAHNALSHQLVGEPELADRGAAAGARFSRITENVGVGPSPLQLEEAWMHSRGHRENLLDPAVDSVGIAVVRRGHQLFAVEDFAHTVRRLTLVEQEVAVAQLVERAGLSIAALSADARQTCSRPTGYVGATRPLFVMRFTASELDHLPVRLNDLMSTGQYSEAAVGACAATGTGAFSAYSLAVLLYR